LEDPIDPELADHGQDPGSSGADRLFWITRVPGYILARALMVYSIGMKI
jgi:hypothetical protein